MRGLTVEVQSGTSVGRSRITKKESPVRCKNEGIFFYMFDDFRIYLLQLGTAPVEDLGNVRILLVKAKTAPCCWPSPSSSVTADYRPLKDLHMSYGKGEVSDEAQHGRREIYGL